MFVSGMKEECVHVFGNGERKAERGRRGLEEGASGPVMSDGDRNVDSSLTLTSDLPVRVKLFVAAREISRKTLRGVDVG